MECCIEELGLEPSNLADIFEMPVLHGIRSLEKSSLSTTGSIEEDTVEYLIMMTIELPWIECDPDVTTTHTF